MSDCCYPCPKVYKQKKPKKVSFTKDFPTIKGLGPRYVQTFNPQLFRLNEIYLRNNPRSNKKTVTADFSALTPVYNNGQKLMYDSHSLYSDHGPGADSLAQSNGTWQSWDGTTRQTPYIINTATEAEKIAFRQTVFNFVFPNGPVMRGLKQLYDNVQPFADRAKPQPSEIENWNLQVIRHFRDLLGINHPEGFNLDRQLFQTSKIANERKFTTTWDSRYPVDSATQWGTSAFDGSFGPCQGGSNAHCGWRFVPLTQADQAPYYNDNTTHPWDGWYAASEGLVGWYGTQMNMMSALIYSLLSPVDGHVFPFFNKSRLGWSQIDTYGVRLHWSGNTLNPPAGYLLLGY